MIISKKADRGSCYKAGNGRSRLSPKTFGRLWGGASQTEAPRVSPVTFTGRSLVERVSFHVRVDGNRSRITVVSVENSPASGSCVNALVIADQHAAVNVAVDSSGPDPGGRTHLSQIKILFLVIFLKAKMTSSMKYTSGKRAFCSR